MDEDEEGVDEIVVEFLSESHRHLDGMKGSIEILRTAPDELVVLDEIFRGIHSIKGTAGALDYLRLQALGHTTENVLDAMRQRKLAPEARVLDVLVESMVHIRRMLASIEARGHDRSVDIRPVLPLLADLCGQAGVSVPPPPADLEVVRDEADADSPEDGTVELMGEMLVKRGLVTQEDVILALREQRLGDPRRLGEILVDMAVANPRHVRDMLDEQGGTNQETQLEGIPVGLAKLDQLMATVGELVLVRNRIERFGEALGDRSFDAASGRLTVITGELQDWVMQTRTQPIETIWNVFPRALRHLEAECGKQARIDMEGEATALDRSILEALRDPMSHLVRNCVDHGIETPDERRAVGKPVEGVIALRAHHEGGQVTVEIADDGGGIDACRIRDKAVARGLFTEAAAARLSEDECLDLIFRPGLSTAEKVTNVSGRGVGMDVVRTNIERIGGEVVVQSRVGHGTKFVITIPLSLAIIPVLMVETGGDRYAVPQSSVHEVLRILAEDGEIERVGDVPVHRLRGRLLPLIDLAEVLGLEPALDPEETNIVVVQAGERWFGLIVDSIQDASEIVVRPLNRHIKQLGTYAGATVLGDGSVALLLDVAGLGARAGQWEAIADEERSVALTSEANLDAGEEDWLIVQRGEDQRLALRLSDVTRLEEVSTDRIERAGECEVVQYRGEIMTLIRLGDGRVQKDVVHVIVHNYRGRSVGVVVDQILDIVRANITVVHPADGGPGIREAAVIQGRIIDMLDVNELIAAILPSLSGGDTGVWGHA